MDNEKSLFIFRTCQRLPNEHDINTEDYCVVILANDKEECISIFDEYYNQKKLNIEFGRDF